MRVKVKAALLLSGTGMIGGWVGVAGHRLVREEITLLLLGVLMIVAAGQMWWRTTLRDDPQERSICAYLFPRTCWLNVSGVGMAVGFLTGFFGVGGGFVIVPALTLLLGFPMRVAVGTSLPIIRLIALAGFAAHARLAQLNVGVLSFLIAGAVIGMLAGRQVSRALSPTLLTRSLSDIDRSTAANDGQASTLFSAPKNPQRIPVNTPPVFRGLRPRICLPLLRLVTNGSVGQAPRAFAVVAWAAVVILIGHNLWEINGGIL